MSGIPSRLPAWFAHGVGQDPVTSGSTGSAALPTKGLADAWRREMERQQQQAWFLPVLPVPVAVSGAGEPVLATTAAAPRVQSEGAVWPSVLPSGALSTERASKAGVPVWHDDAAAGVISTEHTASAVKTLAQDAVTSPGSDGTCLPSVGRDVPILPSADGLRTLDREAVRTNLSGGATADAIATLQALQAVLQKTAPGLQDAFIFAIPSPLQVDATQVPCAALPLGNETPTPVRMNGPLQWDEPVTVEDFPASSPGTTSPHPAAQGQLPEAPLPIRVHCGWQHGQLTVWIGHDRGHAESAAMLVRAIDRWLATQRLSRGFVINGEPLRREAAGDADGTAPPAHEISEQPLDGTAQRGLRRAFNAREHT